MMRRYLSLLALIGLRQLLRLRRAVIQHAHALQRRCTAPPSSKVMLQIQRRGAPPTLGGDSRRPLLHRS